MTDPDPSAGGLVLLILLTLAVATVLLLRSLNRHLRRVPPSFRRLDATGSPARPPAGADPGPAPAQPADQLPHQARDRDPDNR